MIAITVEDLGTWGASPLRSEYDPRGPAIRINSNFLASLPESERIGAIAFAIGHELYHHCEHCGTAPIYADRALREAAADDFARALGAGA